MKNVRESVVFVLLVTAIFALSGNAYAQLPPIFAPESAPQTAPPATTANPQTPPATDADKDGIIDAPIGPDKCPTVIGILPDGCPPQVAPPPADPNKPDLRDAEIADLKRMIEEATKPKAATPAPQTDNLTQDADKDSVPDELDQCKDTPRTALVYRQGDQAGCEPKNDSVAPWIWVVIGGLVLLGIIIWAIVGWVRRKKKGAPKPPATAQVAKQTTKKKGAKKGAATGAAVVPVILLALLIPSLVHAQVASVETSAGNGMLVKGHPNQQIVLKGANLCDPATVTVRNGVITGAATHTPTQVTIPVTSVADTTQEGPAQVNGTCRSGGNFTSGNNGVVIANAALNAALYGIKQTVDAQNAKITSLGAPPDLSALRRQIRGQNTRLAELEQKISALDGLEDRAAATAQSAARTAATEVVTAYGKQFGESVMARLAELDKKNEALSGAVKMTARTMDGHSDELATLNKGMGVAMEHTRDHEPKKVERKLKIFGGKPNPRRDLAQRVLEALEERNAADNNSQEEVRRR